ncbi:MAG: hypothetical protein JWR69_4455 [Pedosphaera sp.]|nr:hypothetical protein [Pedosphaera sp.]
MPKDYRIESCEESPGYRYRLDVSTGIQSQNRLVVVQLNPSTADATKSDPTIGKVSYWAREHEFGHVTFLNLFAFRTVHPTQLVGQRYAAIVGPRNDAVTRSALKTADNLIFAWGRIHPSVIAHYQRRMDKLKKILGTRRIQAVGAPVAELYPRHGRMWNENNRTVRDYHWPD